MEVTKKANEMLNHLYGKIISRCVFDYYLDVVILENNYEFTLRINCDFMLKAGVVEHKICIGKLHEDSELSGLVVKVLHSQIRSCKIYDKGKIEIHFSNQISFNISPSLEYESWETFDSRGMKIICQPGGKLAIWGPQGNEG